MTKPNYPYEKRQKEIAKKAKQEEKRRLKHKNAPNTPSTPNHDIPSQADVTPAGGTER